jgi:hypothetical protein
MPNVYKKRKKKQMSDLDLLATIARRRSNATSYVGDELSQRRENLLSRYMGEKYGDEVDGQSKVTTRECLEAVEWAWPSLLRIFLSSPTIAEFEPIGPEDVDLAKQETFAVNKVLKENNGFMRLAMWIKDTLMNMNAYAKVYWDEKVTYEKETWENLLPQEVEELYNDPDIEIIAADEDFLTVQTPMGMQRVPIFSIELRKKDKKGRIVFELVPQEELTVDGKLTEVSLEHADYINQRVYKTRSDLVSAGFDKNLVYSLASSPEISDERSSRKETVEGYQGDYPDMEGNDEATEMLLIDETYLYVDYDGDGIAELRQIISVNDTEVLSNEEVNMHPFVSMCAVPLPHTHIGMAWMELVEDLQEIDTTLTRQLLNNMYRTNNPRPIVGPGVNFDDVLNDAVNAPIRAANIDQMRMEPVHTVIDKVMPAFELLNARGESRTGVSRTTKGLDANALSRVRENAYMGALDQANQRLEALAMVIAEAGFKPLMLKIHKLLKTHRDTEYYIQQGQQWVQVNPATWNSRDDITITVGLGTGNKQAQMMGLEKVMARQQQLKAQNSRLVSEQNEYEASAKMIEIVGLHAPERYFTNPQQLPPPQPPPPDPIAEAQKLIAQAEMLKAQSKAQNDQATLQQKARDAEMKLQEKIMELEAKLMQRDEELKLEERDMTRKEVETLIKSEIEQARYQLDQVREINQAQDKLRGSIENVQ